MTIVTVVSLLKMLKKPFVGPVAVSNAPLIASSILLPILFHSAKSNVPSTFAVRFASAEKGMVIVLSLCPATGCVSVAPQVAHVLVAMLSAVAVAGVGVPHKPQSCTWGDVPSPSGSGSLHAAAANANAPSNAIPRKEIKKFLLICRTENGERLFLTLAFWLPLF